MLRYSIYRQFIFGIPDMLGGNISLSSFSSMRS